MKSHTLAINKNWEVGTSATVLNKISNEETNIAIYNRDIHHLSKQIDDLLKLNIELRTTGDMASILSSVANAIDSEKFSLIIDDVHQLLKLFSEASEAKSFRLLLATIDGNMCRRFHTDMNDLRMLCTYYGPGTLWLPEDNIDRQALNSCGDNECIALDKARIQQAETGAVLILKGALYPEKATKAAVHRSPTIEESGERRLLLRIDTNEFLNFE